MTIESVAVTQRDTLATFLVDIGIEVSHPTESDLTLTVEFSRGPAGPWTPASAQALDRKHDAISPLTGVPIGPPPKSFNYVWQPFFDLPEGAFTDVHIRVTTVDDLLDSEEEIVGPLTIATVQETTEEVLTQAQARRSVAARTPKDFLGAGPVHPLRRGSRDFVTAEGVELIRGNFRLILGTRAAHSDQIVGELEWRPDFGSRLWTLRHRNRAEVEGLAVAYVQEAVAQEPRVILTDVVVEEDDAEPNKLQIRVFYRVITENVPGNVVILPEEFEETVTLAA